MKLLDEWLKDYFDNRPQLKRPPVDVFGEHEMPKDIRRAFEKLFHDYLELSERLYETR